MELTELNTKNKSMVLSAVILIVAAIIALNIYKKQTQTIASLKMDKENEAKKNEVLTSISGLEERLDAYKGLLKKKEPSDVISTFNAIAQETGIKIISVRPQEEQKAAAYVRSPYELNITTPGYHNLGKFISRLENYSDVYTIDGIEITPETQEAQAGLSVRLTVNSISSLD